MSTIKRALSNTFYLANDWLAIMILGYIFWIMLAKLMPAEGVGLFSTISNIAIFLTIFTTFGFNNSAAKLIPQYLEKKKHEYASGIVRFIFEKTFLFSIIVSGILLVFLEIFLPNYIGFFGALAVILYLVPNSLYTVSQGCLLGFQGMKKIFLTDALSYFLKIILSAALIYAGFSYFGPVIAFAASTAIALAWRISSMNLKKQKVNEKEIWEHSAPAMVGNIGVLLFFQSTIIIMGIFRSFADVGIFTIAFMLTTPVRAIFQSVSGSLMPMVSGKWTADSKNNNIENLANQAMRYSLFLIMPVLLVIFFFTPEILLAFTKAEYLAGAVSMQIISLASILFGLSYILFTVLYSIGDVKRNRDINLIGGFSNTALSILLIPTFGMLGASVSYLLASAILLALSVMWYGKHFKIHSLGIKKVAAASIVLLFISVAAKYASDGLLSIALSVAIGIPAYFSFLFYAKFFSETDVKVISAVSSKVPFGKKFFALLICAIEKRAKIKEASTHQTRQSRK